MTTADFMIDEKLQNVSINLLSWL